MRILKQSVSVYDDEIDGAGILKRIERAGRVCYKSEDKITESSAEQFVSKLIKSGHESVLEHEDITLYVDCDRGISHEIVRHRIGSYSQESTRYCNYEKFNNEIAVIEPLDMNNDEYMIWFDAMQYAERAYFRLVHSGVKPQIARDVLPSGLKTCIAITFNVRQWRHFIKQRIAKDAHPKMRILADDILTLLKSKVPVVFDDLEGL
jgi:thymidylate synthase (FAD)